MDETQYVYIIVDFQDPANLERAVKDLSLPPHRTAILGSEASDAAAIAERLDVRTKLDPEIRLDSGQDERLQWHIEHTDRPILAAGVMAEEGRDMRQRLEALGGVPIDMPNPNRQANDEAFDPGMRSEEPDLPPQRGHVIDP